MEICKLKPGDGVITNERLESKFVVDYLKKFNIPNPIKLNGQGTGCYGIDKSGIINNSSPASTYCFLNKMEYVDFLNLINQPDNQIVNNFEIY